MLKTLFMLLLLFVCSDAFPASGYATRYWDCCKPHCGWQGNTQGRPIQTCNIRNESNGDDYNVRSACEGGDGFTCHEMIPWSYDENLAYAYAAVPGHGAVCGKCYELTFTGKGHWGDNPGAALLKGKRLIVKATNIGWDVGGGQFDILIPGGGVGQFNACSRQWGVPAQDLGEQYGGFLSRCQKKHGYGKDLETYRSCVREQCYKIFSSRSQTLMDGCLWFVDWYKAADNPNVSYREVSCTADFDF